MTTSSKRQSWRQCCFSHSASVVPGFYIPHFSLDDKIMGAIFHIRAWFPCPIVMSSGFQCKNERSGIQAVPWKTPYSIGFAQLQSRILIDLLFLYLKNIETEIHPNIHHHFILYIQYNVYSISWDLLFLLNTYKIFWKGLYNCISFINFHGDIYMPIFQYYHIHVNAFIFPYCHSDIFIFPNSHNLRLLYFNTCILPYLSSHPPILL